MTIAWTQLTTKKTVWSKQKLREFQTRWSRFLLCRRNFAGIANKAVHEIRAARETCNWKQVSNMEAREVLTFSLRIRAHFHWFIILVNLRYNGRAVHWQRFSNRAQTFPVLVAMRVHLFSRPNPQLCLWLKEQLQNYGLSDTRGLIDTECIKTHYWLDRLTWYLA